MSAPAVHNPRSRFTLAVTVLGFAAVPAFFLPFAVFFPGLDHGLAQSPVGYFWGPRWPVGVPFLLPLLVSAASIRWVLSGRLSAPQSLITYATGLAATCTLLTLLARATLNGSNPWAGRLATGGIALGLLGSALLLIRNRRARIPDALTAIVAVQIPFLAWMALVLLGSTSSVRLEIGAYFLVVTAVAYLIQIVAVSLRAPAPGSGR